MESWSCSAPAESVADAATSEHERRTADNVRHLGSMKLQAFRDNLDQYLAAIRGEAIPDGLDPSRDTPSFVVSECTSTSPCYQICETCARNIRSLHEPETHA